MISLIKQIIACLTIATLVAVACYFLPFVNGLLGDYLIGFFLASFVLPVGMKWYEAHMVKVKAISEPARKKREKECKDWHKKDSEAMNCPTQCYDERNIDRQLHVFDGFKE